MRSCGVIVEYNPFHNGHKYHLEQAKKVSNAECLVAVMSGNFLQRGEPAVLDKWTRANEALQNGADLVIELPFSFAVQASDYFTRGGVKLLQSLGVDSLCFGTDIQSKLDYEAFGKFHHDNKERIDELFQTKKNNGQSYPQQMTEVYREIYPEMNLDFSSPNHILGMGYAKENACYKNPMTLFPIKRVGSQYHDEDVTDVSFASATAVRKKVFLNDFSELSSVLPDETLMDLKSLELVNWEKLWPFLKYQLITQSIEELKLIYQMVEGLEYRLKDAAKSSSCFDDFMMKVKSKRYTWTRIQRLCLYVLLQIKEKDVTSVWNETYIRVLGFNSKGRQFLKEKKDKSTLPIITNINKKNEKLLSLDIKAGMIYSLIQNNKEEQDYYQSPIYLKEEKE